MLSGFFNYLRYELNRAPLTVEAYSRDISQFQGWISPACPEDTDFCSVTSADIRAWLAALAKQGQTPSTLRRKIITLRSLFKWMIKSGLIKTSPLRDVALPKISKPLPDFIKTEEIEAILHSDKDASEPESPEEVMKNLIVEILYTLGIRRAELIGINDADISYTSGEIKVMGKRSKQRIVPAPQQLLDKIRKWQSLRDKDSEPCLPEMPLFVVKGKRITPKQVYNIVHTALSSSTARKKSPHALRHSFASAMLNGGAEIDSVREFLGHSSLATTQIYTHISLNEIKKAYSMAHPRANSNKK